MRILVTGGTGFIGSYLVERLIANGELVISASRRAKPAHPDAEHHVVDVGDAVAVERIGKVDAIVHLAGLADASSSFADPLQYSRTNALGTLNMLEMARKSDAVFVFASSQRVYRPQTAPLAEDCRRHPVDPYGYSKLIGEEWVQMYHEVFNLRTVVLRFFSVYGPGQALYGGTSGVVTIFVNKALKNEPLKVNDANLRDFTYVTDVVEGIVLALKEPVAIGNTYNIATGEATSIGVLASVVKDVTGSQSAIVVAGNDCGESYVADITRARNELGYEPSVGLRRGLELYVERLGEKRKGLAQS